MEDPNKPSPTASTIRWAARIMFILAIAFISLFAVDVGVAGQRCELSRSLLVNPGATDLVGDFVRVQVLARPFAYDVRHNRQKHEHDQGLDRRPRERTSVSNGHEADSTPCLLGDAAWIERLVEPEYERVHGRLRPS